jgi:hypothetical protein
MSFEQNGFVEQASEQRPSGYQGNNNNGNNNYQRPNNYQNNNGGGNGGGYQRQGGYQNNNGGGGYQKGGYQKGNFQKRSQEPEGPAELYMPYVITGNREAPSEVVELMKRMVTLLEKNGYTMRSGGMDGPEDAVEKVAIKKEIHLPWKDFNNKDSKFTFTPNHAKEIAAKFQPGYEGLKPVIQTFLAKNVRMLMGKDLKGPALFMITWSEDGAETLSEKTIKTGNAGHAVAIASTLRIPVFNLGKQGAESRLNSYLNLNHVQEESSQPRQPEQQSGSQPNQQYGNQQNQQYNNQPNRGSNYEF